MPSLALALEPGEVAKITRTGPYIFAERMRFLTLEEAKVVRPDWHGPVDTIQKSVAAFYRIALGHMRSPWRDRTVAWPRQRAMWLCTKLTEKSLVSIGKQFGDRHHTTVMHAVREVDRRMAEDPLERAQMKHLLASLEHLRRVV